MTMALSCSSGSDFTMTLSSSTGHSDLDVSWHSDTNLDSGGWSDPGHPHGAHMSNQALTAIGPRTQI